MMKKLKSYPQNGVLKIIASNYAGRNLCKFIILTQSQMVGKKISLNSLVYI